MVFRKTKQNKQYRKEIEVTCGTKVDHIISEENESR